MWKYIVTWTISTTIMVSCPSEPKADEFGALPTYTTSCAVMHTQTFDKKHSKEFFIRDSAMSFYKRGLDKIESQRYAWALDDKMSNIKIDSVLVK